MHLYSEIVSVSVTQYVESHEFSEKLRDKFLRNIFIAYKTGVHMYVIHCIIENRHENSC